MKPESILHADILDIIFENRNKEYGAYELRSHYKERLVRSLLIVLFLLIAIWGLSIWLIPKGSRLHVQELFIPDTEIGSYTQPEKPLPPRANPAPSRRIATLAYVTPTIVREITPTITTPAVEDLDQSKIGTVTMMGNKGEGTNESVVPSGQAGNNEPSAPEEKESVLRIAEYMPEFPGGMESLKRFLSKNLRVPKDVLETGEKVKVVVKFVVDKEGIVRDFEVMEHGGNDFDEEVLRVMKKMPHWKPGMQNGRNVAVYYYLPVTFQGPDEN